MKLSSVNTTHNLKAFWWTIKSFSRHKWISSPTPVTNIDVTFCIAGNDLGKKSIFEWEFIYNAYSFGCSYADMAVVYEKWPPHLYSPSITFFAG